MSEYSSATLNPTAIPTSLTPGSVQNEGCALVYWYRGTGPLLIMIPGAGSQAQAFFPIIPYLCHHFTVVAYDRRQQSGSKIAGPFKPANPIQQARDVVAIMKAMGRTTTSLFANSAGGKIAFQLAVSFPDCLDHVIAHETPSYQFLPDGDDLIDWCCEAHDIYLSQGLAATMAFFRKAFRGFSADDPPRSDCEPQDWDAFWQYEFMIWLLYCPDLRQIKQKKVSIAVAAGAKSEDANYARSTFPQADIMGCPRLMFPGNHAGFEVEPEVFSKALLDAFEMMEKKKKGAD